MPDTLFCCKQDMPSRADNKYLYYHEMLLLKPEVFNNAENEIIIATPALTRSQTRQQNESDKNIMKTIFKDELENQLQDKLDTFSPDQLAIVNLVQDY